MKRVCMRPVRYNTFFRTLSKPILRKSRKRYSDRDGLLKRIGRTIIILILFHRTRFVDVSFASKIWKNV